MSTVAADRVGRPHPFAVAAWVLLAAVALYAPHHVSSVTTNDLSIVIYMSVGVLSLNVLTGLTGQVSIGHSAFFGLGAYTTGILVADHDWPYLLTLAPATVLAFAVGLVAGLPAVRIKGFHLALVTLGIAMVFPQLLQRFTWLTGGTAGKNVPSDLDAPSWSRLDDVQWRYYLLLAIAAVVFLLVHNIRSSRVGRAMTAVRDNDTAARLSGIDVARYRVVTFGLSAAIAAVAGSMFTMHTQYVAATDFGLLRSIDFLVGMIIGGSHTLLGAVVGGLFVEYAPEYSRDLGLDPELTPVLYGGLMLLAVYVFKDGIVGTTTSLLARWRRPAAVEEATADTPPEAPEPTNGSRARGAAASMSSSTNARIGEMPIDPGGMNK